MEFKYFYKFKYKILKINLKESQKKFHNKEELYDKLYHQYIELEMKKDILNKKYCEEEAKNYPFVPKINHVNLIYPKKKYSSSLSLLSKENINNNNNEYHSNENSQFSKCNSFINLKYISNNESQISLMKRNLKNNSQKNLKLNPNLMYNINNSKLNSFSLKDIPYFLKSENNFSKKNELLKKNIKNTKPKSLKKKGSLSKEKKIPKNKRRNSQSFNNLLYNLNEYNSLNSYNSSDNLSELLSFHQNEEEKNLHKKNQKSMGEISTSTNLCDRGTNYYTDKQSRIERLSDLNLFENLQNEQKHKKPKEFFYTFKTGRIYYNTYYPLKNHIPLQSLSDKSTNILSPRNNSLKTNDMKIIKNKNKNLNNKVYLDFSGEDSYKKLTTQNSKYKNTIIYEKDSLKNINFKNLEISSGVVNEYFLDKAFHQNLEDNSHVTLQSISDSKLFELSNHYLTVDDSLDKFLLMKNVNKKKYNGLKNFSKKNS